MSTPRYRMVDSDGNPWTGTSESAWVNRDGSLMKLEGDVAMQRTPGAEVGPATIRTSELQVRPKDRTLETAAATRIEQPGSILRGTGMRGDLNAKVLGPPMCTTPSSRARAAWSRRAQSPYRGLALALAPCARPRERPQKDLEVFASCNKSMLGNKAGENHTLLSGNVRMVQGSLKVTATSTPYDGDGDAPHGADSGRHLEQLLGSDGDGSARRRDRLQRRGIAVLTGDVVVIQEGKSFRVRVTYDTNTGHGRRQPGARQRGAHDLQGEEAGAAEARVALMLAAEGLRKTYGGRTVVRDFGFSVAEGEVVGLLGPNGAGKTTCFYMVVGLVAVDDGTIRLDDKDITERPMHERARLGSATCRRKPRCSAA